MTLQLIGWILLLTPVPALTVGAWLDRKKNGCGEEVVSFFAVLSLLEILLLGLYLINL